MLKVATEIVQQYLEKAEKLYQVPMPSVTVSISNRMSRSWGLASFSRKGYQIKLAGKVFKDKEHTDAFKNTVIHEVAHIVDHVRHKKFNGHGPVWKRIMQELGAKPLRCVSEQDKREILKNRKNQYWHACSCTKHQVTPVQHNKILQGRTFTCKLCKTRLSTEFTVS